MSFNIFRGQRLAILGLNGTDKFKLRKLGTGDLVLLG
ncbi:hypothetical protein DSUL_50169 [Desulfovibrionales bacterium]